MIELYNKERKKIYVFIEKERKSVLQDIKTDLEYSLVSLLRYIKLNFIDN